MNIFEGMRFVKKTCDWAVEPANDVLGMGNLWRHVNWPYRDGGDTYRLPVCSSAGIYTKNNSVLRRIVWSYTHSPQKNYCVGRNCIFHRTGAGNHGHCYGDRLFIPLVQINLADRA